MRRLALLLPLLCGALPSTADAQCLPFVRWEKHTYFEAKARQPVTLGAPVSGAVGGCADYADRTARPVAANRIEGVPPQVALARDADTVELAAGFMLEFPQHPLRAALGLADTPGTSCSRSRTVRGTTRFQPSYGAGLLVYPRRGKRVQIEITSATRYTGPRRFGLPYIGRRVRVRATGCPVTRYGSFKMLSASRLTIS
jgi:hypothetical protein